MCSSLRFGRCGRANKSTTEAADLFARLRLGLQVRRELHGASSVRSAVDLLVPRAVGVSPPNSLTAGSREPASRCAQVCVVERIGCVDPDLKLDCLMNVKRLADGHVHQFYSRAVERVAPDV